MKTKELTRKTDSLAPETARLCALRVFRVRAAKTAVFAIVPADLEAALARRLPARASAWARPGSGSDPPGDEIWPGGRARGTWRRPRRGEHGEFMAAIESGPSCLAGSRRGTWDRQRLTSHGFAATVNVRKLRELREFVTPKLGEFEFKLS